MSDRWSRWATPLIAVLALVSSAVGIANRFTYDDRYIIELDSATHTLHDWWRVFQTSYWPKIWGGDGYRPITLLAFRIEWVLGGGNPAVFHAVNIALYVAASVLVFALAKRVLPLWAALVMAALFAVHPVHVEAVANVVGQSELIVATALLSATLLYIKARRAGHLGRGVVVAIGALYVVACFAKEHAIVLPALLVAAELTVIDDTATPAERARKIFACLVMLAAVAIAFVAVRSIVLSDRGLGGFQPFTPFRALHISDSDRVLTAIGVVPQWVRLLLWPARLSSEYGPPKIEIAQGPSLVQLPGMLLLLGILGIGVVLRRRQPIITFGIAFLGITLLPSSNFLLPAGIVLAERTLFLPSVGAMMVVGALAVLCRDALRSRFANSDRIAIAIAGACAALVIAGAAKSMSRTRVWRDNDTLFKQAVVDSPDAYRAHFMLGAWYFENKHARQGEAEYRKALKLFPYDPFLANAMAEQYRDAGSCAMALPFYRWTHDLDPNLALGHSMYAWCLLHEGKFADARSMAFEAIKVGGDEKLLDRIIALSDSAMATAKENVTPSVVMNPSPSKVPESVQKAGRVAGREPSPK